jgi:phosphatidylinositol glycan class V
MNNLIPLTLFLRLLILLLTYLPSAYLPPFDSSHLLVHHSPLGGLKWDAIHYTSIALHGYEYEQQGAWMPLWPLIMRYAGWIGYYIMGKEGELGVEDVVRGGEGVNLIMNLGSTYMLYKYVYTLFPKSLSLVFFLIRLRGLMV